jgi:hypothetical protein
MYNNGLLFLKISFSPFKKHHTYPIIKIIFNSDINLVEQRRLCIGFDIKINSNSLSS